MDRDTQYWREQGHAAAQNPHAWLGTADALKRSADTVLAASDSDRREFVEVFSKGEWPSIAEELADLAGAPFLSPVYLQLAGLAIENLAKGIAVSRDPSLVEPDHRGLLVDWPHISVKLFAQLEIPLDDEEAALVERLSVFVEWAGRYPVPRFAHKLPGIRSFERSADPAAIDALFARLRSELVAAASSYEERGDQERKERGHHALQALAPLPKQVIDGSEVFVADGKSPEPAAVVVCASCGRTLTLSPNHPGGFCGCDDLHWYDLVYDGSLGRHIPVTEVLKFEELVEVRQPAS